MNDLLKYEQSVIESMQKQICDFRPGDTVSVAVKVVEGTRQRMQEFKGTVIARKNNGLGSTFRVRKVTFGEGVERVFQLYSPSITVKLERRGRVRRAKLYYLRERTGKSARIAELKKS